MELVLAQQNSFNNPNNSHSCGTVNKCSMCLYKLICERSPFCCIKDSGGNCDFTPIVNELSQLEIAMANEFSNINKNIIENTTNIDAKLDNLTDFAKGINNKLNDIISKLNSLSSVSSNEIQTVNAEILPETEQGLVPFSNDDTVLVQKKNVFGKTKWVEEKKK